MAEPPPLPPTPVGRATWSLGREVEMILPRQGGLQIDVQRVPAAATWYTCALPAMARHVVVLVLAAAGQRYDGRFAGASQRFVALPDRVAVLPAGSESVWRGRAGRDTLLVMKAEPDLLRRLAAENGLAPAAADLAPRFGLRDPGLSALATAFRAQRDSGRVSPGFAQSWATLALLRIMRLAPRDGGLNPALDRDRFATVRDHVEQNLDGDLGLERLAQVAGTSVFHFARAFRRATGRPPHAYVLARRVERAKALIRDGQMGLAEIAFACGFSGQSHLTSVFRKEVGETPGRWRAALGPA
jgi:AraC family transcriptional regulator